MNKDYLANQTHMIWRSCTELRAARERGDLNGCFEWRDELEIFLLPFHDTPEPLRAKCHNALAIDDAMCAMSSPRRLADGDSSTTIIGFPDRVTHCEVVHPDDPR